jgi:dihydroorotate dehydrogenase electron transfer subunit
LLCDSRVGPTGNARPPKCYIKIALLLTFFNGQAVRQFAATIVSNEALSRDLHKLQFEWNSPAGAPKPGQFFTVRVSHTTVPLLRRPFAFSDFDQSSGLASAIYQRRGRGTEILAGKRSGEQLDVIGPLGNSFPSPSPGAACTLVAGGIGLGPMLYYARRLASKGHPVSFIFGCRTEACIPDTAELEGLSATICTDDGSAGFGGTVVDFLNSLEASRFAGHTLFACGPLAMLKGCHEVAAKHHVDCFVSVEQVMACGVGACMGCVVRVVEEPGYARVCREGPVFDSKAMVWT